MNMNMTHQTTRTTRQKPSIASLRSRPINRTPRSSVDTLRVSIDLQPLLRQLNIPQELQRHPDQMSPDLVELLTDDFYGLEPVVQMPGFARTLSAKESIVVFKVLDIIVGVRVEQVAEDFGVGGGARGPHLPEVFVERVADHGVVLVAAFPDVVAVSGGLGVGVFGCVEGLRVQEAEVLTPEHAAEGGGVLAGYVGLAIHH
jgi:hypothetical protein